MLHGSGAKPQLPLQPKYIQYTSAIVHLCLTEREHCIITCWRICSIPKYRYDMKAILSMKIVNIYNEGLNILFYESGRIFYVVKKF